MNLSTLTALEIQRFDRSRTIVLIPIGSAEQHGPHLPLGAKSCIAEAFAYEITRTLKKSGYFTLVGPTVPFAPCQASFGFPSNFSISARVFSDYLYEIGLSFQREGFKWVFFVHFSHSLDSLKAIQQSVDDLNQLQGFKALDPFPAWIFGKKPLTHEFLRGLGLNPEKEIHADVKDTSLLLYLDEDMVQKTIQKSLAACPASLQWETLKGNFSYKHMGSTEGFIGSPASADPELGKVILEEGGECVGEWIRDSISGKAPPTLPLAQRMILKLIDLDDAG
jgi:creatinine amidohydrolase